MPRNDSLEHLIQSATVALNRDKNYAKTFEYIDEILKTDPESIRGYLLQGQCELELNQMPKAIRSFGFVISKDPENVEALLQLAFIDILSGNYDTAKEFIGKVLSVSNVSEAHELLGDINIKQSKFADAIENYDRAIKLAPVKADLYFKKGLCNYQLHDFKNAYRNAELAASFDSSHPEARALAKRSADSHIYGNSNFIEKCAGYLMRGHLERQFREQIEVHEAVKEAQRQNDSLSVDAVMRIKNRMYFDVNFPKWCDEVKKKNSAISLIYLDIDNMKIYNSKYGYSTLDQILGMIGDVLNKVIPDSSEGMAIRMGGDELVVALKNATKEKARKTVARILSEISAMNQTKLPAFKPPIAEPIQFSIGITSFPEDLESTAEFLSWADQLKTNGEDASLFAKRSGKNQVCEFELAKKDLFLLAKRESEREAKEKADKGERPS